MTNLFAERYRVIRQLGAGAMGVVFEAEDQMLLNRVAIKTIRKNFLTAEQFVRFQREATILAGLNHPNIGGLYLYGITDDNEPYLVMKLEQGESLAETIERQGPLPISTSLAIFFQICDALHHAHQRNVLHRDLKPSNVILRGTDGASSDETVSAVVLDFGIAFLDRQNSLDTLTKTGIILGTPAYMSPEQIRGEDLDARTDVYAMGCVMFETLTGSKPYSAPSILELMNRKLTSDAPDLNSANPEVIVPKRLCAIVAKALARHSEERYRSMAELRADLADFSSGGPKHDESEPLPLMNTATQESGGGSSKPANKVLIVGVVCGVISLCSIIILINALRPPDSNKAKTKTTSLVENKTLETINIGMDSSSLFNPNQKASISGGVLYCDTKFTDSDLVDYLSNHRQPVSTVEILGGEISGKCFEMKQLRGVRSVRARQSKITDEGLKSIANLPNLTDLVLDSQDSISEKGITCLSAAPNLSIIHLSGSWVGKDEIRAVASLPHVIDLTIKRTMNLTDEELDFIAKKMHKLQRVCINETAVTDNGLAKLVINCPKISLLSIDQLKITDEAFHKLLPLKLRFLSAKDNLKITDRGLATLAKMKSLTNLTIDESCGTPDGRSKLQKAMPNTKFDVRAGTKRAGEEMWECIAH